MNLQSLPTGLADQLRRLDQVQARRLQLKRDAFTNALGVARQAASCDGESLARILRSSPAGASWLLVHTSAEFYRSDFVGSTSKRRSGGGTAASFVGGAIGGAIVMSLAQGKERPFRFGEIGLIAVVRD
ncbi:MAG: hypothetical protein IPO66_08620 [Rhodanobacteraceae bacterium]|nr:hypothetical protein [Rhodanobacteraceae bacterium]